MKLVEDVKTLTDAKKKTKTAWVAALGVAGITLALALSNMATDTKVFNGVSSAFLFVDVILSLSLAFGIYRYSRWCAVGMFTYYCIDKLIQIAVLKSTPPWIAIIFLYCFFQGIQGTFAYHRLKQQATEQSPLPIQEHAS
jgi:hypothetical protein